MDATHSVLDGKFTPAGGIERRDGNPHRGADSGMTDQPRPRVAIVGAGPAGAFAAACLLRTHPQVEIDLFDRLPTPWGLLRAGVRIAA